ncbi:MAG TPA: DUF1707 domain-containing protein [Trebonia sp.]
MRIGDAERDAAAADLGEHYAAGRLSLGELNERLDAVFTARTLGQLTRIMADLPGSGWLPWRAGPGRAVAAGIRPAAGPYADWGPHGLPYDGYFGTTARQWHPADCDPADFESRELPGRSTPTDRAGRFAALSLLLLAMLIWLFTALLFARHGFYQPAGPLGPPGPYPVGVGHP